MLQALIGCPVRTSYVTNWRRFVWWLSLVSKEIRYFCFLLDFSSVNKVAQICPWKCYCLTLYQLHGACFGAQLAVRSVFTMRV
jgi:hypothetical protein